MKSLKNRLDRLEHKKVDQLKIIILSNHFYSLSEAVVEINRLFNLKLDEHEVRNWNHTHLNDSDAYFKNTTIKDLTDMQSQKIISKEINTNYKSFEERRNKQRKRLEKEIEEAIEWAYKIKK